MISWPQRREFVTLLGGAAAAWPLAARAQREPALPVIGMMLLGSPEPSAINQFRQGLRESGYVEGQNVAIEFRSARGQIDRLPDLADELAKRRVTVIVAPDFPGAALAAKAATSTIPIIFGAAQDPVESGLVASLNRPGSNVTGINDMNMELGTKRLGILHDFMPAGTRFGVLVNPGARLSMEHHVADAKAASLATGRQIEVFSASTNGEIEIAFAGLLQREVGALALQVHILFLERRATITTLATQQGLAVIGFNRLWPLGGALMSYGPVNSERYRLIGVYTGRVLKGEKPADLPVMRATRFEFVINLTTAKALKIDIPPKLLALADEVIE
jgi:putative ABC transport system substrate-binding protein